MGFNAVIGRGSRDEGYHAQMATFAPAMVACALASQPVPGAPARAEESTAAPSSPTIDVGQLFATTCGFCHSNGGRVAGKGPQLLDAQRSDDLIRNCIKTGKVGSMQAFGQVFSDAEIDAIGHYIRSLRPKRG